MRRRAARMRSTRWWSETATRRMRRRAAPALGKALVGRGIETAGDDRPVLGQEIGVTPVRKFRRRHPLAISGIKIAGAFDEFIVHHKSTVIFAAGIAETVRPVAHFEAIT